MELEISFFRPCLFSMQVRFIYKDWDAMDKKMTIWALHLLTLEDYPPYRVRTV
ncbi:hypothetical protein [Polaromonas sp. CG9_12]|nr:hypothetical protein [Polaromonas sp. CG9_12]